MTFEFTIQIETEDENKAKKIYQSITEYFTKEGCIFSVLWKISREVIN